MNRSDLDKIPSAETGNCLQSRALLFLYQWYPKKNHDMLIVSHAAYIRSLVNTCYNQKRDTPVNIGHNIIHHIKHPWSNIDYNVLKESSSKCVLNIRTIDKSYLLKETIYDSNKNYTALFEMQKGVYDKTRCCPEIYNNHVFSEKDEIRIIKVEEFLSGQHIVFACTSKTQVESLIGELFKLGIVMKSDENNHRLPSLENYIENIIIATEKLQTIHAYRMYLLQAPLASLDNNQRAVLVDVHAENILFFGDVARFVDFDNAISACDEFQIGCLLSSFCFLKANKSDYVDILNMIVNIWPNDKVCIEKVKMSVTLRAIIGAVHFEKKREDIGLTDRESSLVRSYIDIFKTFSEEGNTLC